MPQLATDAFAVHVDPQRGGKLTSLRDLRSGREWLLTPAAPYGRPAGYGEGFTAVEMSGWDEMAPTISACRLVTPWGASDLPDHGEVWSVPWDTVAMEDRRLTLRVRGRALPYELQRTILLLDQDRLRLTYEVRNRGEGAIPVLWAAHPQFTWRSGCRVELPPSVTHVLDVTSEPDPNTVPWDEQEATRLDHLAPGQGHKVWTLPGQGPAWCRLRDSDGGSLTITIDPKKVPYLGIWWDASAYAPLPVVALEPSTGHFDDLAVAVAADRVPWLPPGEALGWDVELTLQEGARPTSGGLQAN